MSRSAFREGLEQLGPSLERPAITGKQPVMPSSKAFELHLPRFEGVPVCCRLTVCSAMCPR
jgi:hypothetical protein